MLAQKGGSYLKEDGSLDVNNDKMVEVLQCMKDMQDAGALATVFISESHSVRQPACIVRLHPTH